jgi:disulfide oxidoreductase YuzD
MENQSRKKLYSALSSQFDLGSYEEFNAKMDNPESRKKLYGAVSNSFDLGSYEEFESKIASSPQEQAEPQAEVQKPQVKKKEQGSKTLDDLQGSYGKSFSQTDVGGFKEEMKPKEKPRIVKSENFIPTDPNTIQDAEYEFARRETAIDERFMKQTEEQAVPKLNYLFEDYGFRFEEYGVGNQVKATAPNGQEITFKVNPFTKSEYEREKKKIEDFISKNRPGQEILIQNIPKSKSERKIVREDLDVELPMLEMQDNLKQLDMDTKAAIQGFEALSQESVKDIGELVDVLSRKVQKGEIKKEDAQKQIDEKVAQFKKREEGLKAFEQDIQNRLKGFSGDKEVFDKAFDKYNEMKKTQTNLRQSMRRSFEKGLLETSAGTWGIPSYIYDLGIQGYNMLLEGQNALIGTDAKMLPTWEELKQEGYTMPFEAQQQLLRERKSELDKIETKYSESVTDLISKGEYGLASQAIATSISESTPFMLAIMATQGAAAEAGLTKAAQNFVSFGAITSMSAANRMAELNADEENVYTQGQKLTNATMYGMAEALSTMLGEGLFAKTIVNIAKKSGMNAAAKFAETTLESLAAKVPFISALSEPVEEVATAILQNTADIVILGEDKSVWDGTSDAAIVALAMGSQFATIEAATRYAANSDQRKINKDLDQLLKIGNALASNSQRYDRVLDNIDKQVQEGNITQQEAVIQKQKITSVVAAYNAMPTELSREQQREALPLIIEKREIDAKIEGKDPAMIVNEKARIEEINNKLQEISNKQGGQDAVQISETAEVDAREQARDSEGVGAEVSEQAEVREEEGVEGAGQAEIERGKSEIDGFDNYYNGILDDKSSSQWEKDRANKYFNNKKKFFEEERAYYVSRLKENPSDAGLKEYINDAEAALKALDQLEGKTAKEEITATEQADVSEMEITPELAAQMEAKAQEIESSAVDVESEVVELEQATATEQVAEVPALRDVESTAKALETLNNETPPLQTQKTLTTNGLPNLDIVSSNESSSALESEIGGDIGGIDNKVRAIPIQEYDVTENNRSRQIAEQIEENGWIEPLIVSYDKNGNVYIVEGQHRAAALKQLGYDKAPVIVIYDKSSNIGKAVESLLSKEQPKAEAPKPKAKSKRQSKAVSSAVEIEEAKSEFKEAYKNFIKEGGKLQFGGLSAMPAFIKLVKAFANLTAKQFVQKFREMFPEIKISNKAIEEAFEQVKLKSVVDTKDDKITSVIKKGRDGGFTEQAIRKLLLKRGFTPEQILEGYRKLYGGTEIPDAFLKVPNNKGINLYNRVRLAINNFMQAEPKKTDTRSEAQIRKEQLEQAQIDAVDSGNIELITLAFFGNIKYQRQSVKDETGFGNEELAQRLWMFSKDGISVEKAAESIMADIVSMYSDDLNTPENLSKIRDSIIDYLKTYSKKEEIENALIEQTQQDKSDSEKQAFLQSATIDEMEAFIFEEMWDSIPENIKEEWLTDIDRAREYFETEEGIEFLAQDPKTAETKRDKKEIREFALNTLKADPLFGKLSKELQNEIIAALDDTLGIRKGKDINTEIAYIKNEIANARKSGDFNLYTFQGDVDNSKKALQRFIKSQLAGVKGITASDVDVLINKVLSSNKDNILQKADEVISKVEELREKDAVRKEKAKEKAKEKSDAIKAKRETARAKANERIEKLKAKNKAKAEKTREATKEQKDTIRQTAAAKLAEARAKAKEKRDKLKAFRDAKESEIKAKAAEKLQEQKDKKENIEKELKGKISNLRSKAKDEKEVRRELNKLIKDYITKDNGFTDVDVRRLTGLVERITPKNYYAVLDRASALLKAHEEKVKKQTIKDVYNEAVKNSKLLKTAAGRKKSDKLVAEDQNFMEESVRLLKAIITNNTSELLKIADSINAVKMQPILFKQSLSEPLTAEEKRLLDRLAAFELLGDIENMTLEEVQDILKDMKELFKQGRQKLIAKKAAKAQEKQIIDNKAATQIQQRAKSLYVVNEDGETVLKDPDQIAATRISIRKSFKEGGFSQGVQAALEKLRFSTMRSGVRSITRSIAILDTLTNALDNPVLGLNFFRDNVYKLLARGDSKEIVVKETLQKAMDDIAKKIFGSKSDYKKVLKLLRGEPIPIRLYSNISKSYTDVYIDRDIAMKVLAWSLNPDTNLLLQNQNIGQTTIDLIKSVLGDKLVKFAEETVAYLSSENYEQVNKVYSELNNRYLPQIENYFPRRSAVKLGTKEIMDGDLESLYSAMNQSFLNDRSKVADLKILGAGFSDILDEHFNGVAKYLAYAEIIQKLNNVFASPDVNAFLSEIGLKSLYKSSVIFSINPESKRDSSLDNTITSALQSISTVVTLGLKPIQVVKQSISFLNEFPDYNVFKNRPMFIVDFPAFLIEYAIKSKGGLDIKTFKRMYDLSPSFRNRVRGYMSGDLTRLESGINKSKRSVTERLKESKFGRTKIGGREIGEFMGKNSPTGDIDRMYKTALNAFTSLGDANAVIAALVVYDRNVANGMPHEQALEIMEEYNTRQQSLRAMDKSALQRNANFVSRYLLMYASAPLLQLNKTMSAGTNIMRSIFAGKPPRAYDVRTFYINYAVANILFTLANNMFKLWDGDDEDVEEVMEELKMAALGINTLQNIPILGAKITQAWYWLNDINREAKPGVDFLAKWERQYNEARKEGKGEIRALLRPSIELATKLNTDPFIGMYKGYTGESNADDLLYDLIGVSKSARPWSYDVKKDKSMKEEDPETGEDVIKDEQEYSELSRRSSGAWYDKNQEELEKRREKREEEKENQ